jgi:tetratricopeptide (TPR) repeat protein
MSAIASSSHLFPAWSVPRVVPRVVVPRVVVPPYPGVPTGKPAGGLLDAIDRNLWYGHPGKALARLAGAGGPRAGWLRGVALLALGRYEEAGAALEPWLPAAGGAGDRWGSLAASAFASGLRQRERFDESARHDERALAAAGGDPEAASDALVGLTADAVGRGDAAVAADRLAALDALPAPGWRCAVRREWVRCELALLTGRPADAVAAAHVALRDAEEAQAPRHIAKSLLFLGVSVREVARGGGVDAIFQAAMGILRRGERVAGSVGAVPLRTVAIRVRREAELELLR